MALGTRGRLGARPQLDRQWALTLVTVVLGFISAPLGWAHSWHQVQVGTGLLSVLVGLWSQMISATTWQRFWTITGMTFGGFGLAIGMAHGGFS